VVPSEDYSHGPPRGQVPPAPGFVGEGRETEADQQSTKKDHENQQTNRDKQEKPGLHPNSLVQISGICEFVFASFPHYKNSFFNFLSKTENSQEILTFNVSSPNPIFL